VRRRTGEIPERKRSDGLGWGGRGLGKRNGDVNLGRGAVVWEETAREVRIGSVGLNGRRKIDSSFLGGFNY
jgi:hypothetical protein